MIRKTGLGTSRERLANRYAAWAAQRAKAVQGFARPPEPRSMGLFARGKQMLAGNLLLAGHLVETGHRLIWDIPSPDAGFTAEIQGFTWLDDLAALGTLPARDLAQAWTREWIARDGRGKGAGWTPELTGRRVIRWIHHASFTLREINPADAKLFFGSLAQQAAFLARRAQYAAPGLPRFEALIGQLYAGVYLQEQSALTGPALMALAADCDAQIGIEGEIASRNPEELLEVLTLLSWALRACADAGLDAPDPVLTAIDRIAPCLKTLRHADGELARFHGGGAGADGRLDHALSTSAVARPSGHLSFSMGFARLSGGRTSLILDAAAPPKGPASATAHASTGAFELTSGRRPLIINCGSGAPFGPDWYLAGRATQSHSALTITGWSSSRFGRGSARGRLEDRAEVTALEIEPETSEEAGAHLLLAHNGWINSHGLSAERELMLSADGRKLTAIDSLIAREPAELKRFAAALSRQSKDTNTGIPFTIRFHLHPEVDATLDLGGSAVSMQLRSGEIWVLRHDGQAHLSLESSASLEKGRLKPRPTLQIVLSAQASSPETRIGWTLAKAQDTPLAIRDLDRDDPAPI